MIKNISHEGSHRNKFARFAAPLWTLLILVGCMMPSSGVPKVEIPLVDKWTHFILFGGYSFLWMWRIEIKDKRSVALVIISGVVYGAVIELLQGLLVMLGRSMEFMDWVADTIGVLLGWFLYAAVMRMSGNNKSAT